MIQTLRRKILAGYGVALGLTAVVLVWAFANLLRLGRASDAILRENYRSILAAEKMINALERQDSAHLLLILGYTEEGIGQHREHERQFLQWFSRAKDNITVAGEDRIIQDIDAGYASYLACSSQLLSLKGEPTDSVRALYHQTLLPSFLAVREACIRLREMNQNAMFEASDQAGKIARRASWSLGVIGVAVMGIGLGFSLFLSSLLVRPLRHMMSATQEIAEGNYDVGVPGGSPDELGLLAGGFNAMVRKLKAYRDLNIEQILAEKRKGEAVLRSIDDGIVVVDADLKVTGINPTAAYALGVDSVQALERHFPEVVHNDALFGYIKQSAVANRPPRVEEAKDVLTVKAKEGVRYFQFSISPIQSAPGPMLGVVLLLRDVTKLKELDRLKSEFVMTASHELRTPLTSIGMGIDLLLESAVEKLDQDERQLLAAAHEDVQRLKALVNNLLDLSKIEAGKMEMAFERVPVRILTQKAAAVLKAQVAEKSIALHEEVPEGIPDVRADANKVTWVLTNLISNALRYTDRGGYIRISAEPVGHRVHVSVADNGAGIPYEYQARIFEKFVQVGSDRDAGGSGLGLAICREIVHAHGGAIWVESTPGRGSTFTFTLPAAQ